MLLQIPDIGEWHQDQAGNRFEVVAVDEDDRTIEIQHFDGTIEELDFVTWDHLNFLNVISKIRWKSFYAIES